MRETMRRYLFKLYPTAPQAARLHEQRKMMADLWNALKQRREDTWSREHKSLTFFDLTNEITQLRHECPEWAAIPAITAHRVAKHLTDAYAAFFRRVKAGESPGYPRWQKRDRATTIPLGTMEKTGWRLEQREDNPFSWALHYGGVSNVRDRATWIHARGRMPARRLDREVVLAHATAAQNGITRFGGSTESVTAIRPSAWSARSSWSTPGAARKIAQRSSDSRRLWRAENRIDVTSWRNADIIWRDNNWWLSICVAVEPRREPGRMPVRIEFDLIDGFARVNGRAEYIPDLGQAQRLQERADELKSERDQRWPRGRRLSDEERESLTDANAEIAKLLSRAARIRKNALHVWTARLVSRASAIEVVAPPLKETVKTGRGDEKQWGANVGTVAKLNRHVLSQAPGMAIQFLRYKAEEAGIRCDVIADDAPKIAVGGDLVSAGKTLRRARRDIRRKAA